MKFIRQINLVRSSSAPILFCRAHYNFY